MSLRCNLGKSRFHNSRGQDDLTLENGRGAFGGYRSIKTLYKVLQPGFHMEVSCQKRPHIRKNITAALFRESHKSGKCLKIAFGFSAPQPDECLLVLV